MGRDMGATLPVAGAISEGQAIERALFWGRCTGGLIIFVLGPVVTPGTPEILLRGLGLYFFAYAFLMLHVVARATSPAARHQAAWLAHVLDTIGFLGALVLNATDPGWITVSAAPLYVLVAVARLGTVGGISAAIVLAVTHLALAVWRETALGIPFDLARETVHVAVYGLAALLTIVIDGELRALRRRRELQLALHEPLLQAHDDMGQGVLIAEGERAVHASDGFLELTGTARADIVTLASVYDLVPAEQRESTREQVRALPPEGGVLKTRLVRSDGSVRDVEVALRRYRTAGRDRSVAIIRDVTVHDRALAELEHTQRLESLGSLVGGIAHDFNNLLAVILNNAHLALAASAGAAARREIEEIKEEAERGVSLTRQMLVFARGARSTATVPVDVRREIRYAERLLRRTIGAGVKLDVRVSDLSDVALDPGELERMLVNLVVNARDAMPKGGRVSIAASGVALAAQDVPGLAAGRYLRIVVSDEGAGMPPEVASRAFEPFFTTKPKGQGTGLGLSTVYGIVRRAGGHVGLASAPGAGTAVTIHLPATTVAMPTGARPAMPTEEARGSGERVLLVDDDEAVRRSAARILRDAGYAAAEAARPSEAIDRVSDGIDLLVTDIALPEISGRELADRVRERMPDLPVLFISGHADEEDPSLLAKPFTPGQLLGRVRDALRTPEEVA